MGSSFTTISVSPEVRNKLLILKSKLGIRTWDEFFEVLITEFNRCADLWNRERVRKVMCNEFRESSATLPAWVKLLTKELNDPTALQLAVTYLKPNPQKPDEYVVDTSKCVEG